LNAKSERNLNQIIVIELDVEDNVRNSPKVIMEEMGWALRSCGVLVGKEAWPSICIVAA
jgi:hypothetical protein